jgi:hypothetical protein
MNREKFWAELLDTLTPVILIVIFCAIAYYASYL